MNDSASQQLEKITKAVNAAYEINDTLEDSFQIMGDDVESCLICTFFWNDPVKKDKVVTRCTICSLKLHEPCLRKNSCPRCDAIGQEIY